MTDELSEAIRTLTKIEEHMIARNRALRSKALRAVDAYHDPALHAEALREYMTQIEDKDDPQGIEAARRLKCAALGVMGDPMYPRDYLGFFEYPACMVYLAALVDRAQGRTTKGQTK